MIKEILQTVTNCGNRVVQWKCDGFVWFGMNSEDWIPISGGDCNTQSKKKKKRRVGLLSNFLLHEIDTY